MDDPEAADAPLFLACTRPAMWRGVPLEALVVNGMATTIVFVLMANPLYLLAGVAMHAVLRAIVRQDCNRFTVLRQWAATTARARNVARWGGASVSPLPLGRARHAHEVRIHA